MDPFNYILIFLICFLAYIQYRKYVLDQKIKTLRLQNNNKQVLFFATGLDDLGNGLIQFYGEVDGGDIYPIVNKLLLNGVKYEIFEVYASETQPQKPSDFAPNLSDNVAIVIEDKDSIYRSVKKDIKIYKVYPIEVHK